MIEPAGKLPGPRSQQLDRQTHVARLEGRLELPVGVRIQEIGQRGPKVCIDRCRPDAPGGHPAGVRQGAHDAGTIAGCGAPQAVAVEQQVHGSRGLGAAGDYYNCTAGINWRPHANILLRPELRMDWYDGNALAGGLPFDGGQEDQQLSGGFDAIFTF